MISHLRSVRLPTAWRRNDTLHHARHRRRGHRWKTEGKSGSGVIVSSCDCSPWVRSSTRERCAEHGNSTVADRGNSRRPLVPVTPSGRDGYRTLPSSSVGGTRWWSSASSSVVPYFSTLVRRGLSILNTDDDRGRTLQENVDVDNEVRKAELLQFFRKDFWNDIDRVLFILFGAAKGWHQAEGGRLRRCAVADGSELWKSKS